MIITSIPILAESIPDPHRVMVLPFAAMLLSIALMPMFLKHHWERYYHFISVGLGAISVSYYIFGLGAGERMVHVADEYFSFIVFIGSLFVVSGGIHVRVRGEAKPVVNCVYLFIGAILANVVGTTGASMLLIRPWIRMNKYRYSGFHTAFFIFIVSNVGGCLTPVGDPPLFLGYLIGVPFWWVALKCWPAWCIAVFTLIGIFYVADRSNFLRAPKEIREAQTADETFRIDGLKNLGFLLLILSAVFLKEPHGLRELIMAACALGSYFTTGKPIHEANHFSLGPIKEVAWLFAGIFATMVPVLDFLQLHAGSLGIRTPMQFYWLSGSLSGVLDNAPTYLTFLAAAFGLHGLQIGNSADMATFLTVHDRYLIAVSLGSVFFGAMTYIGNGPNFMVKAVADHARVHTPGFFGYIVKFSLPVLVPVFLVVAILYFSRFALF